MPQNVGWQSVFHTNIRLVRGKRSSLFLKRRLTSLASDTKYCHGVVHLLQSYSSLKVSGGIWSPPPIYLLSFFTQFQSFCQTPSSVAKSFRWRPIGRLTFDQLDNLLMKIIIDLRLCSRILNVPNDKNRCVVLCNGNSHFIDTIHPIYHITLPLCVYANVLIFVPMLSPSSQPLCRTHSLSLGLSAS